MAFKWSVHSNYIFSYFLSIAMQIVLVFLVYVQISLSLRLLPPPKTRDVNGIQPKCMGRYHQREVRKYISDPLIVVS